jgi:hypothetical protein
MMKTGKVYGMKESDNEGISHHTGPESYFDDPQELDPQGGNASLLIDHLQKQTLFFTKSALLDHYLLQSESLY